MRAVAAAYEEHAEDTRNSMAYVSRRDKPEPIRRARELRLVYYITETRGS